MTSGRAITEKHKDECRETVIKLAHIGCSDVEIGHIVGMSEISVHRHMRKELDEGRSNLKASIRKAQIKAAVQDRNPTMLIWLGKAYLGQKDSKNSVEHSGGMTVEKVVWNTNDKKNKSS